MATLETVFDRDLLLRLQNANPERLTPFWQSGAFNSSGQISQLIGAGSQTFEVPYIMDIDGNLEANYSNTIYTDIAMPRSIEAGKMQGRMAYLNESFIEANLTRALTGQEPLRLIAAQIDGLWAEQAENRAVATVIGIRNSDQAGTKALATDISAGSGVTDANRFNSDAFIDVESTMGRRYRESGVMIVHPKVWALIQKQDAAAVDRAPSELGMVYTYKGRTVIESDKGTLIPGTATTARYVTYFVNTDAFAAESVPNARDMKLAETEATGNGGGHTILHTRRDMLIHPQGFSFTPAVLTGGTKNEALSASWSDLTAAASWTKVLDDKNIPFRYLVTNI